MPARHYENDLVSNGEDDLSSFMSPDTVADRRSIGVVLSRWLAKLVIFC